MNENLKRIWSYANAVLLLMSIITFMIWPENYFLSKDHSHMPEVFVMLTLISTAAFLFTFFISSFITIQRSKECNGNVIFYLLGSLLSILFLMVIKVMSDEIAHEWLPTEQTIYQHGEFWLLISSMGLIMVFLFIAGSGKKNIPVR